MHSLAVFLSVSLPYWIHGDVCRIALTSLQYSHEFYISQLFQSLKLLVFNFLFVYVFLSIPYNQLAWLRVSSCLAVSTGMGST